MLGSGSPGGTPHNLWARIAHMIFATFEEVLAAWLSGAAQRRSVG